MCVGNMQTLPTTCPDMLIYWPLCGECYQVHPHVLCGCDQRISWSAST